MDNLTKTLWTAFFALVLSIIGSAIINGLFTIMNCLAMLAFGSTQIFWIIATAVGLFTFVLFPMFRQMSANDE